MDYIIVIKVKIEATPVFPYFSWTLVTMHGRFKYEFQKKKTTTNEYMSKLHERHGVGEATTERHSVRGRKAQCQR